MAVRKLHLLVVDDDPAMVRLLTTIVNSRLPDMVEATGFHDPHEALRWLDGNCCDVMLSDIEMPQLDGLQMLHHAKRRNAWTQVVFMTAFSTWDRITEAIEQGASDYLLKPLDPDDLVALVKQQYARFARWQSAVTGTLDRTASTTASTA